MFTTDIEDIIRVSEAIAGNVTVQRLPSDEVRQSHSAAHQRDEDNEVVEDMERQFRD